jgi:hypothetical protein
MRVVWSFWSKPFRARRGRVWREPKHHLLAWGLSLRLARQHFAETQLVTDTSGKAMLVDKLGLEFDEVSTELDSLRDADLGWWALGKVMAYSLQNRPFVHLDTDVFLWKALPSWLTAAPVFTQCPEVHNVSNPWEGLRHVERLFERHGLSLPVEWQWASSLIGQSYRGILGSNRPDFIGHYARTAIRLVSDPAYAAAWADLPDKSGFNDLIEQFMLTACLDYHRINPKSPYRGMTMRHLFSSWSEAHNPSTAAKVGYTHVMGEAKTHPQIVARLEHRVAQLDPAFLRHCQRVAQSASGVGD